MKRPSFFHLLFAIGLIFVGVVSAQAPETQRTNFLGFLKKGQKVGVKTIADRFQISIEDAVPENTHTILEVGSDFLLVDDLGSLTETRIPVYAIKAVVRHKLPK